IYSLLVPLAIGISRFKYLNKEFRFFLIYFVASLLVEYYSSFFRMHYRNNMPISNVFTLIEFGYFAIMYLGYFKGRKRILNFITISSILFIGVALADMFVLNGIWKSNSYGHSTEAILMVIYSSFFFYFFFKGELNKVVWKEPMFWVSAALLLFFTLNLFLYLSTNILLVKNHKVAVAGYLLSAGANIICNLMFAISFLCFREKAQK
ncbi:MAG: hypothetical protein NTX03_13210, partial [Bacteroidetes bacterium]|nr:hypothetical protein [Bacteroidota bacterium]